MVAEGRVAALVDHDASLADVYEQVVERLEIEDAAIGSNSRWPTPRRVFRALFEILRSRRRNGMPLYPEELCQAVLWLLVSGRAH